MAALNSAAASLTAALTRSSTRQIASKKLDRRRIQELSQANAHHHHQHNLPKLPDHLETYDPRKDLQMLLAKYSFFGLMIYGICKAKTGILDKKALDSITSQQEFDKKKNALRNKIGFAPPSEGPTYRLAAITSKH